MKERANEAGFQLPRNWNPSNSLGRSKGMAIRTPKGWEITESGKLHLRNLGVSKISPAAIQVATDLREILSKINDSEIRSFLEEAIGCYEAQFFRSAIVMSWTGAVAVLHKYVHSNYLTEFNNEAKRVNSRCRDAISQDDSPSHRDITSQCFRETAIDVDTSATRKISIHFIMDCPINANDSNCPN